jgi:hypothetical protein
LDGSFLGPFFVGATSSDLLGEFSRSTVAVLNGQLLLAIGESDVKGMDA